MFLKHLSRCFLQRLLLAFHLVFVNVIADLLNNFECILKTFEESALQVIFTIKLKNHRPDLAFIANI